MEFQSASYSPVRGFCNGRWLNMKADLKESNQSAVKLFLPQTNNDVY